MSLLRTSHFVLAGAVVAAIVVPWWVVAGLNPQAAARLPFNGEERRLAQVPDIPATALQGRLFFGGADYAETQAQVSDPAAVAAAAPPPLSEPPKLLGTAISRRGRGVAVVKLTSGDTRTVARGELVDGWQITVIADAAITVVQNGETRQLSLERGQPAAPPPASLPVSTATASPPPQRPEVP